MKKQNGMMYPKKGKTPESIVKCKKCGKDLTPRQAYYYVDSCNYAITNSAPPYCRDCYTEVYKRG